MSRILLITTEPLPLPGWPTTGAGLRAWNLAEGLRARGHEVRLLMPADCLQSYGAAAQAQSSPLPEGIDSFERERLAEHPGLAGCDVIVLQHWGVARHLPSVEQPLAIDLAGPHLLERAMWGSDYEADLAEKLAALRRADFVTVAGQRQRDYFLPFLQMAGWTTDELTTAAPVVPYSVKADPQPAPPRPERLIVGGYLLPWQDPTASIETALEALDEAGRGELLFIGGPHPHFDFSRGRFDDLMRRIEEHPRARVIASTSYDRYLEILREGGIALDLVAENAERRLAFTSRTVQYLACGLPVIHNDYAELADIISESGAGWTFAPDDRAGLRNLLGQLLNGEADVRAKADSALNLARERLDPERTIEPLDAFCKSPRLRPDRMGAQLRFESAAARERELRAELESARARLNTLLGKRWVRIGLRMMTPKGAASLAATAAIAVAGSAVAAAIWLSDRFRA